MEEDIRGSTVQAPPAPKAETEIYSLPEDSGTVVYAEGRVLRPVKGANSELYVPVGGYLYVGREELRGVVSPNILPYISRRHCVFYYDGKELYVMDLGSTNGTYVNDDRLAPSRWVKLNSGDRVSLANMVDFVAS